MRQDTDNIYQSLDVTASYSEDFYKGIIAVVLASLPNPDFNVLWDERKIMYLFEEIGRPCRGVTYPMEVQDSDIPLYLISIANCPTPVRQDETSNNFLMDLVAHELAHVFYLEVSLERSMEESAFVEIRADLQALKWGYLKVRTKSYLYGEWWKPYLGDGIIRHKIIEEVLEAHPNLK